MVTPYLFASGLEGTVATPPLATNIDSEFDELVESLDVGAMLSSRPHRMRPSGLF